MVPAEPRPHESDCQQHRAPASSFCGSIIPSLFPIPGTVAASCACLCDICVPLFALSPLRYLVNSCFYQIISVKILGVVLVLIQQAARFADPARRERGPGPLRSNPRRSVPLAHVSVTATFPCEIIRVGDSPFTELRGNEYLLSSRGDLPLPPLCPSSASSRRPVYAPVSCFISAFLASFSLVHLAPLSFQSLFTRPFCHLALLAFCHATA